MTADDAEVARLLEVWVALRRTALRKRTPEAHAAAEAAYVAYRDRLVRGVPQAGPAGAEPPAGGMPSAQGEGT
ncbi:MAG TPA: hypothetical protein VNU26_00745 [Mycobacteriales bacterium]|nr:hypothetical protein [Mycobacteriales bacterium]